MRYQEIFPDSDLRAHVKSYWQLEGRPDALEVERVVPDGRMEIIFHFGDSFERVAGSNCLRQGRTIIAGQLTSSIEIRPTGQIGIFAVRFRAQGFSSIFEESSEQFQNQTLNVSELFPTLFSELEEKIYYADSMEKRVSLIESFLRKRLTKSRVFDRHTRAMSQLLYENPREDRILQLSREFGISLRQLERQFKAQVGISPSQFIKIARFQMALRIKLINPQLSFSTLAAECGYFDQSHFSRDFKQLSGLGPGQYFGSTHEMADHFSL